MYNGLGLLRNRLSEYTDILQEYFVPHDQLVPFLDETRRAVTEHDAVLMNASIRVVHDDDIMLSYAGGERFSLVLYLSQQVSGEGNQDMADLTRSSSTWLCSTAGRSTCPTSSTTRVSSSSAPTLRSTPSSR
jgi:hypothetical protein